MDHKKQAANPVDAAEHTEAVIMFEREMREFLQSLIDKGIGDCDEEDDDDGDTPC